MSVTVRPATDDDLPALAGLDLKYPTGRYLHVKREGVGPEHTFRFEWREREPGERVYATYTVERLRGALKRTDLFLAGFVDDQPAGLLMVIVPDWTDAAEITDLAIDRPARRQGLGRALVNATAAWARDRNYRALWVEPSSDNADAIAFYSRLGFRLSGFNDRMYSNEDDAPGATTLFMHLEL